MTTMTSEKHEPGPADGGIDMKHVRPIATVVRIQETTARALDAMNEEALDFIPVVGMETGKLLGIVLRNGIERGCLGMDHDPATCGVQNHLKTAVTTCFGDEPLDPALLADAGRKPLVVVDRHMRPIGVLREER